LSKQKQKDQRNYFIQTGLSDYFLGRSIQFPETLSRIAYIYFLGIKGSLIQKDIVSYDVFIENLNYILKNINNEK
jgi:hypothetical protein